MHSLTELPNELWFTIFSYLNIVDIFQAFHQFDPRFHELVYECAQQIRLPIGTTTQWLDKHMPHLENRITIMYLHVKSLEDVFQSKWSFPNLRLIHLERSFDWKEQMHAHRYNADEYEWSMSLRIGGKPIPIILMSSLNFLRDSYIVFNTLYNHPLSTDVADEDDYNKTLSCPYVERLSATVHDARSLSIIRTRAPNLTHLKMNYEVFEGYEGDFIADRIEQTTRLVTLEVTGKSMMHYGALEKLIDSYKSSLRKLVLDIRCHQPIDGYRLESILKSCQQLKKLHFFFRNPIVNIDDRFRSFQSEWWLDARRPAVYIQPSAVDDAITASMPICRSFTFRNGLYNWLINKGDQNSSFLRFNTNQICFTNQIHQSIDLKLLYSINRIFTSFNQSLSFNYCNLETVRFLFDLLMDDASLRSLLPNVKCFSVGSQNKLDSLTLCVWILFMPNLQDLDISRLTTFNKTELGKDLASKIDEHEHLQTRFNQMKRLILFSQNNDVDTEKRQSLSITFQTFFVQATIS